MVLADDIETLDGWYQTLRSKHIHPSARATAEFSQYLESIKSKAMSPNSLKRALKWPRALSPNTDTLIFRVIPPNALQGYVLLRRKSQQYAYKKFCVLIEQKIYYASDKQDCKKDSKFKGYVDLCDIHTLDSNVSKGAWKYVIVSPIRSVRPSINHVSLAPQRPGQRTHLQSWPSYGKGILYLAPQ